MEEGVGGINGDGGINGTPTLLQSSSTPGHLPREMKTCLQEECS